MKENKTFIALIKYKILSKLYGRKLFGHKQKQKTKFIYAICTGKYVKFVQNSRRCIMLVCIVVHDRMYHDRMYLSKQCMHCGA